MQVLYKDEEGFLAVMEVTKAAYIEDEELMEICGPEEDIAVAIDAKSAEKAIRELYANGKADLSAYEYQDRDFDDDDFDDDDDDAEYEDIWWTIKMNDKNQLTPDTIVNFQRITDWEVW